MEEIKKTQDIVKTILINYPETRNSDNLLYTKVCAALNPDTEYLTFSEVMLGMKELGIPCFETVGRTRRKLQAKFPELSASADVRRFRRDREEGFREYANE